MADASYPQFLQTVFDTTSARRLAEFYRQLLGYAYRAGDEPPADRLDESGRPDESGRLDESDWLVLEQPGGSRRLAFQQVARVDPPTWPEGPIPQQLHLDLMVTSPDELRMQQARVLELGGTVLRDRFDDPEEPLIVFADPSGHPFCIFVG